MYSTVYYNTKKGDKVKYLLQLISSQCTTIIKLHNNSEIAPLACFMLE